MDLPSSLTTICRSAFYDCESLSNITIPEGVVSIGYDAFHGCQRLTSITLPNSLTSLESDAFEDCSSVLTIQLGTGLTQIASGTFRGCKSLLSINIPSNISRIGSGAFSDCGVLNKVYISDLKSWCSITGLDNLMLYAAATKDVFLNNKQLTDVEIPSGIVRINDGAFSRSTITSITFPNGVTSIGVSAFEYCKDLRSVTLPGDIKNIERYAFRNCYTLENLALPNGLQSIGASAFRSCKALNPNIPTSLITLEENAFAETGITSAIIPDGFTEIKSSTFQDCTKLQIVSLPSSIVSLKKQAFSGCTKLGTINLPNSLTHIEESALSGTAVKELTIPASVEDIGPSAFYGCNEIEKLVFPNLIKRLCYRTLANCKSLKTVVLNEGLQYIEASAICECKSLGSISIPATVQTIDVSDSYTYCGDIPFYNCENLLRIDVSTGNQYYSSQDGVLMNASKTQIIQCPQAYSGKYTMPSSIEIICDGAFYQCSKITEITFSRELKSIGEKSFYNCGGITNLLFPDNLQQIGKEAFYYCSKLREVEMGSKLVSIEENAFASNINIKKITINKNVAPECSESTFNNINFDDCVLFVNNREPYINAKGWSKFKYIKDNTNEIDIATLSINIESYITHHFANVGENFALTYTYLPTMATRTDIIWTSSDTNIATVSTEGVVTTKGAGTYTITATVKNNPSVTTSITLYVQSVYVQSITFKETAIDLNIGESYTLTPIIQPSNASNRNVIWSSSDNTVAVVTNGVVYAIKPGTAIITASSSDGTGVTGSVVVKVNSILCKSISLNYSNLTINIGEAKQLVATIQPANADNKTIQWESDDPSIVSVTKSGVAKRLTYGTAIITATTTDGSNLSAYCICELADGIENIKDNIKMQYDIYTLDGKKNIQFNKGLNLIHTKDKTTKKVLVK